MAVKKKINAAPIIPASLSTMEYSQNDYSLIVEKKIDFFQSVIQKTIIHLQKNKLLDILVISEVNKCVNQLSELSEKIKLLIRNKNRLDKDAIINTLQDISTDLSSIQKVYGTDLLEDLLTICLGSNNISNLNKDPKIELLKSYFHPTGYSLLATTNSEPTQKIICKEISQENKIFHMRVYGIKICIFDTITKKNLVITGILDDIMTDYLNNKYLCSLKTKLINNRPGDKQFNNISFTKYTASLNLKDYLLYDYKELFLKYTGYLSQINLLKQKEISQIVKEFIDDELFIKRITLIQLLIKSDSYDNQYLAYLLYDTLSNDNNGSIDTLEQTILFDSFPWSIKQHFRDAMKNTIQYTTELTYYDVNKIPLDQQICLMNVNNIVKEKAMTRLKEVKGKGEDSGSKARQYLDGLLKIPFGVYKKEHILTIMDDIKTEFKEYIHKNDDKSSQDIYTSVEIIKYINNYKVVYNKNINKSTLIKNAKQINKYIKDTSLSKSDKILYINKNITELHEQIELFVNKYNYIEFNVFGSIQKKIDTIKTYMDNVKTTLDEAVYGHDKAKKQISRIIGQWVNGNSDGHCFGFEGPPGLGKTSLGKYGLSNCLKDENGVSRPFAMIQMGGDCQGSSLVGHNYTYVGSTWGNVVQILIDNKCMNPIIFIDELDKISKTENGKELIGILTHLLDPTQNDGFQDKYFSGIDLDLSKALFILSYNDVEVIDRILLDRIHRIKFTSLSIEEKIVISNKYVLPEIYTKMGLKNMLIFEDDVIQYIIETYTSEAGVRKLKEIFFEIVGEINLEILMGDTNKSYPRNICIEDISSYFKDRHKIIYKKISSESQIGIVNGMYATSLGTGGVLPITAKYFPSNNFLELKLTGLQQEVMKESMHLAQTIAWNLTLESRQKVLRKMYDSNNKSGINIHAGDLDVQKEGPSAGIAITCVLYSLLNNVPIKQYFGVTGELLMTGDVSAIGGLGYKILGSLKSKVTSFIFPQENEKDYTEFIAKYKDTPLLDGISFYPVSTIEEVIKLIFDPT